MLSLGSQQACQYCPELQHCCVAHKALEGGDARSFGAADLFNGATAHLSDVHGRYFAHWHALLALEESPPALCLATYIRLGHLCLGP